MVYEVGILSSVVVEFQNLPAFFSQLSGRLLFSRRFICNHYTIVMILVVTLRIVSGKNSRRDGADDSSGL